MKTRDKDKEEGLLDLAEVLHRLGDEFRKAQTIETPTISWASAEVELESTVEKLQDGTIKFYVLEGGSTSTRRNTMRVRVHILPYNGDHPGCGA